MADSIYGVREIWRHVLQPSSLISVVLATDDGTSATAGDDNEVSWERGDYVHVDTMGNAIRVVSREYFTRVAVGVLVQGDDRYPWIAPGPPQPQPLQSLHDATGEPEPPTYRTLKQLIDGLREVFASGRLAQLDGYTSNNLVLASTAIYEIAAQVELCAFDFGPFEPMSLARLIKLAGSAIASGQWNMRNSTLFATAIDQKLSSLELQLEWEIEASIQCRDTEASICADVIQWWITEHVAEYLADAIVKQVPVRRGTRGALPRLHGLLYLNHFVKIFQTFAMLRGNPLGAAPISRNPQGDTSGGGIHG